MTIRMIYGRRVPVGWHRQLFGNIQSVVQLQTQAWMLVRQTWNASKKMASAHPDEHCVITITGKDEEETVASKIEWMIVDVTYEDKAVEDKEFVTAHAFFENFASFKKLAVTAMKQKMPRTSFFVQPFTSPWALLRKRFSRGSEAIENEQAGKSMVDLLLQLGMVYNVYRIKDSESANVESWFDVELGPNKN